MPALNEILKCLQFFKDCVTFKIFYIVILTGVPGDKQERKCYGLTEIYLSVKLTRGQLHWFAFCQRGIG